MTMQSPSKALRLIAAATLAAVFALARPSTAQTDLNKKVPSAPQQSSPASKSPSAKSPAKQNETPSGNRTHPGGVDINNNLGGGRRVSVERPDHTLIVSEKGRPGFVQHPYTFHGQTYTARTYSYRGRSYNRYYRTYSFHGVSLNVYLPAFYYRPTFYGWTFTPWPVPIRFIWGWRVRAWYSRFGYYFQPYLVYRSAVFWLTDYMIAQDLEASYTASEQAGESDGTPLPDTTGDPALTPDLKQQIAEEVQNQLEDEQQQAQHFAQSPEETPVPTGIAAELADGRPHVFVVGGNLDVTDASGKECVLSDGDTLQLTLPPPSDATAASLVVLSSKGMPDCPATLTVSIQLTDLQEMQNHMREAIDNGLRELQDRQGAGGLPAIPASAQSAPIQAAYAAAAPPPDPNAATEIQQQNQQADQSMKDVSAEPSSGP